LWYNLWNTILCCILGGRCNRIDCYSKKSSIIGGDSNLIITSGLTASDEYGSIYTVGLGGNSIIGGLTNSIIDSENSVILGGTNLTLATQSNTVLVPHLKINNLDQCNGNTKVLVSDSQGNINYREASTLGGGGSFYSCNNNLTASITSNIIGGCYNTISEGDRSSIIGGNSNTICRSEGVTIIGGNDNLLCCVDLGSTIVGGHDNIIACCADTSGIFVGRNNTICGCYQYYSAM